MVTTELNRTLHPIDGIALILDGQLMDGKPGAEDINYSNRAWKSPQNA